MGLFPQDVDAPMPCLRNCFSQGAGAGIGWEGSGAGACEASLMTSAAHTDCVYQQECYSHNLSFVVATAVTQTFALWVHRIRLDNEPVRLICEFTNAAAGGYLERHDGCIKSSTANCGPSQLP